MVGVINTKGDIVQVEIKGVSEVLERIRELGQDIKQGRDVGVFQAANMIQNEVQESIIGNRAETRSVLTGNFANSITTDKIKDAEFSVYTEVPYAKGLEFGTSKIQPRRHFRNTLSRNKDKIKEIIETEIKRNI